MKLVRMSWNTSSKALDGAMSVPMLILMVSLVKLERCAPDSTVANHAKSQTHTMALECLTLIVESIQPREWPQKSNISSEGPAGFGARHTIIKLAGVYCSITP
jgi:hypothetical protein